MNNLTIEEVIRTHGVYSCRPIGSSMFPTLRTTRDTVVLRKKEGRLKRYDVALYRRPDGTCVLHRVMSVEEATYTMCGDNQYNLERNVPEDSVLAYLEGFYRGEKYVSCDSLLHRSYVRFWCASLTLRRVMLAFIHRCGNIKRMIKK